MINGERGDSFFTTDKMTQSEIYMSPRQLIESKHEMVTGRVKADNQVVEIKDTDKSSYSQKRPNKLSWFRCVKVNVVYNIYFYIFVVI